MKLEILRNALDLVKTVCSRTEHLRNFANYYMHIKQALTKCQGSRARGIHTCMSYYHQC